jgi:hypothetical protein
VCGDFGVAVAFSSSNETRSVCYTNRLLGGELGYGDFVDVTVWYYSGASFEVVGYFWATEDGELPAATDSLPVDTDTFLRLVSANSLRYVG